jgi:hypothetical protein
MTSPRAGTADVAKRPISVTPAIGKRLSIGAADKLPTEAVCRRQGGFIRFKSG